MKRGGKDLGTRWDPKEKVVFSLEETKKSY